MANWTLFDNFRLKQNNGNALNLAAAGVATKVALLTSTRTPVTATDTAWSGLSSNEVSGTNYTAGGLAVSSGQSCTLASGTVTFTTSVAVKWLQNAAGFSTARFAIIYDSTSGNLIAWGDLGANQANTAADFQITLDALGIWTSP